MSIQPDSTKYTSNAMPCIINEWVRRQTDKEDTEDYASQYIIQCFIMFTKELLQNIQRQIKSGLLPGILLVVVLLMVHFVTETEFATFV